MRKSECQRFVFIYCVTSVLEGSFPNFSLTCKENSVQYSFPIDIFGKAEMRVKRQLTVSTGG